MASAQRAPRKPPGKWKRFIRWTRSAEGQKWGHRAPALVIALTAFGVSYGHIRHAAMEHGYGWWGATALPVAVDGLVMVAARYIGHAKTWYGKLCAFVSMVAAMVATISGNLLTAEPYLWDRAAAAAPAVLLILAGLTIHLGDKVPRRKPARKPAAQTATARAKREPQHAEKAATRRTKASQTDTHEQPKVAAEPAFGAI